MYNWSIQAAVLLSLSLPPAEPVEVKPHPCKVAWSDEEVLCATYPVWENRETKGRRIGLNAEDLPYITGEMTRKETAGTWLGDYRVRQQKGVCEIWPRGKVPADIHEPVRSDVPVLLISGERDPATPPEMAERASRHMSKRLHVVIPRGAHGGGGECRVKLTNDLLDRGSVQGLGPACAVGESKPTRFTKP